VRPAPPPRGSLIALCGQQAELPGKGKSLEDRRSGRRRTPRVRPCRHADREEERLEASFLVVFVGLRPDRARASCSRGNGGLVKEMREPRGTRREKIIGGGLVRGRFWPEIKRALLQVPVLEKGVPSSQIDELASPGLDSLPNATGTLGHLARGIRRHHLDGRSLIRGHYRAAWRAPAPVSDDLSRFRLATPPSEADQWYESARTLGTNRPRGSSTAIRDDSGPARHSLELSASACRYFSSLTTPRNLGRPVPICRVRCV
jgi:hypothetical protein